jgi:hypothetical protein
MGAPQLQYAIPAGGGVPVGVSGVGTVNRLTKWSAATTIADSGVSDDGTTVSFVARNLSSSAAQTWTLPSDPTALIVGGVLTLNTSQKRLGINCAPGTLLSVSDGIVAAPSYDGIRLGNTGEALFSSTDSIRGFRAGVDALSTVVVGSTTSHDLLLQRGNVTAITLGASGAVTFAGNLTSSAAQAWTLASSTTALNIQSGLLNLDTTNSRVGIGTTSPIGTLDVRATNPTIVCSNSASRYGYSVWNDSSSEFRTGTGGAHDFVLLTSNTERVRIGSTGNVGIGTASPTAALDLPASSTARASLRIQTGAAPTAPNNGDIWFDGTNIFMRVGGVTKTFTLI